MTDEEEPKPKLHIGKRYKIKHVGGDYHGEVKVMRAPLHDKLEVARPPTYLGDGFYDATAGGLTYQTFILLYYKDEPYYVWERWAEDWKKNPEEVLGREYESENNRKIREELERKKEEEKERERQKALAKKDFDERGIAIEYNGRRLDPSDVRIFLNNNHPDVMKRFIQRDEF